MFGFRGLLPLAMAAVTAVAAASTLGAQPAPRATAGLSDPRWTAWIGCWTPGDSTPVISLTGAVSPTSFVCVTPSASGVGVDIASIVNGRIVAKERVDASGVRNTKTVDGCSGWESAKWSADARRVFTRSEFTCPGNLTRKESGIFAMSTAGEWLDVQGIDVMGSTSARATSFYEVLVELKPTDRADSVVVTPIDSPERYALRTARMAAAAPVTAENVLDVVANVELPVAEAWLTELQQRFTLDGATLTRLADAGLPPRVIDLMVALSFPRTFAVGRRGGDVERMPRASSAGNASGSGFAGMNALYDNLNDCSRYGSRFGNRFGGYGNYYGLNYADSCYGAGAYGRGYSPYGNNFYYGNQPIIIVTRPDPSNPGRAAGGGRAVAGRGYTREPRSGSEASGSMFPSSGTSGSRSPSSGTGSSSGGSSSGSAGGDGGGRTAKPRGSG